MASVELWIQCCNAHGPHWLLARIISHSFLLLHSFWSACTGPVFDSCLGELSLLGLCCVMLDVWEREVENEKEREWGSNLQRQRLASLTTLLLILFLKIVQIYFFPKQLYFSLSLFSLSLSSLSLSLSLSFSPRCHFPLCIAPVCPGYLYCLFLSFFLALPSPHRLCQSKP